MGKKNKEEKCENCGETLKEVDVEKFERSCPLCDIEKSGIKGYLLSVLQNNGKPVYYIFGMREEAEAYWNIIKKQGWAQTAKVGMTTIKLKLAEKAH